MVGILIPHCSDRIAWLDGGQDNPVSILSALKPKNGPLRENLPLGAARLFAYNTKLQPY